MRNKEKEFKLLIKKATVFNILRKIRFSQVASILKLLEKRKRC